MYSIILGTTFSPTVQPHTSQCWDNTRPFLYINPKYDQGSQMHASVAPRCINSILGVQYHTTYQTVSTLRYEVLELLKLLLQIVTRESDQHIWLVATSLNFLKYNAFYCNLVLLRIHIGDQCSFPPVREGPQLHWQHFRTVAPQQTQVRTGAPNQKSQQLKL